MDGNPVEEHQRYRVVDHFELPSRFQRGSAGKLVGIALWVIFIVFLLPVLGTALNVLARVWRNSSSSNALSRS